MKGETSLNHSFHCALHSLCSACSESRGDRTSDSKGEYVTQGAGGHRHSSAGTGACGGMESGV